ncbi:DMT family transporter [Parasedimentitalea maritima]|uniref:DMT family transporter n=2 Tax=Parasedimentitalea maritima TaxID=2578117 RepID=A0ABY2V1I6_9RHOB|nr:DMT family transporter [Zongyanglinia marina]
MGLIIKHLSPRYGAAELSAYRNFFGIFPSVLALWSSRQWHASGRPLRLRQWKLGLMRGLYVTVAQFLFYYSLGVLPFATASTITYANAIFVTALAVPLLSERVGWIRWAAVLMGFGGVIMVMQPGSDSFTYVAIAPLGAAFLYALAGVTARLMDTDVPSPLINLYSTIAALIGSLCLALAIGNFPPIASLSDLFWIFAMGAVGGTAVLCMVVSYRMTEQSNLAPFSYFGIPIAFVLGWIFFDETPYNALFPGVFLIIGGGLLVIWRERRLRAASALA